ncbi:MAG: oxidoreductase [Mycobacteriaceae bacterium]
MAAWSAADMPDLTGRTALVTGATSGLGLVTATELARHGARVLLGSRDPDKGARARTAVAATAGGAEPELLALDLADLASVRAGAAAALDRTGGTLDILVNNAGVMAPPLRFTVDGFESQWGTNHLGHAALTWLLYPALAARPGSRVVTVSSLAHRRGAIVPTDLDDTSRGERYSPWGSYALSKLANLLFAVELDRRLRAQPGPVSVASVAAHPGFSSTGLVPAMMAHAPPIARTVMSSSTRLLGQSASAGALPQLYAAVAPAVVSGRFYGPRGLGQVRGAPAEVRAAAAANESWAAGVWALTAEQTGVDPVPVLPPDPAPTRPPDPMDGHNPESGVPSQQ